MKNILLMLMLGTGSLRADTTLFDGENYLCQTMLVCLPAVLANDLANAPDPWTVATTQIASGEVVLISAPSFMTKNDQMATCEGKIATLEVRDLSSKESGSCDVLISFKSADLKYDSPRPIHFNLGRGRLLKEAIAPSDSAKSILLLFRVLKPISK